MNEKPVGSGPFRFVSRTRGQNIVFQMSNHWRAKPAIKKLEFLLVPEASTQVAMLKSGEADIIELGADNAKEIESAGFDGRAAAGGRLVPANARLTRPSRCWPMPAIQTGSPMFSCSPSRVRARHLPPPEGRLWGTPPVGQSMSVGRDGCGRESSAHQPRRGRAQPADRCAG